MSLVVLKDRGKTRTTGRRRDEQGRMRSAGCLAPQFDQGIEVKTVVANDDVPSAPHAQREKRRGVAGEVLMWKVGGAKAAMGATLNEVIRVAQKAVDHTRSMGIGLSPCTIPEVGHPNFTIEPGKMEVGIGHHGEPGLEVAPLVSSGEMASRMLDIILPDLPFNQGTKWWS